MKAIVGRKIGMTQLFTMDGKAIPVTVVEVLPNTIIQVKTKEKDGYQAIQVGYEDKKPNRVIKAEKGIFDKVNCSPKKHLRELLVKDSSVYKVGDTIDASLFVAGDIVDVTGISKGKGFSGSIKRWHHRIGSKGHGAGYPHRGPGSLATVGRTNSRIHPGKHMAGHHGHQQSTILNLFIVAVDVEKNAIMIKGAIPGPKKGLVTIRSAIKEQLGEKQVAEQLVSYISKEQPKVEINEQPTVEENKEVVQPVEQPVEEKATNNDESVATKTEQTEQKSAEEAEASK
jgi:large subunit ribosomal protein L3